MKAKSFLLGLVLLTILSLAAVFPVIDDFESGLPAGTDANGAAIGFITFNDPNSSVAIPIIAETIELELV